MKKFGLILLAMASCSPYVFIKSVATPAHPHAYALNCDQWIDCTRVANTVCIDGYTVLGCEDFGASFQYSVQVECK